MSIHWIFQFTFLLKIPKQNGNCTFAACFVVNIQKLTHARHAPSTQTTLIPILNPNVFALIGRRSSAMRRQDVGVENNNHFFFLLIIIMPFHERTSFSVSLRIREQSKHKHTHTRFINSRDKDHLIMNRRIERITYENL